MTPAGIVKFKPVNDPVFFTVAVVVTIPLADNVTGLTSVDPSYRAAATVVLPIRSEVGVKPVPLIETPMLIGVPAIA